MANIALENPFDVPEDFVEDVVVAAELPSGSMMLILGDSELDDELQAATVAYDFVQFAGNIYGLEAWLDHGWECGVSVGERWTQRHDTFPAYFAYLLGHEFGHATTVLKNLTLAAFEDLVLHHIGRVAQDRRWRWDDLPYEVRYDQFGVAIAEIVCGRTRVEEDFATILDQGLSQDSPRIKKALELEPRLDLRGLKEELAEFCSPYRQGLIESWEEKKASSAPGIAGLVVDFEWLWN